MTDANIRPVRGARRRWQFTLARLADKAAVFARANQTVSSLKAATQEHGILPCLDARDDDERDYFCGDYYYVDE